MYVPRSQYNKLDYFITFLPLMMYTPLGRSSSEPNLERIFLPMRL